MKNKLRNRLKRTDNIGGKGDIITFYAISKQLKRFMKVIIGKYILIEKKKSEK